MCIATETVPQPLYSVKHIKTIIVSVQILGPHSKFTLCSIELCKWLNIIIFFQMLFDCSNAKISFILKKHWWFFSLYLIFLKASIIIQIMETFKGRIMKCGISLWSPMNKFPKLFYFYLNDCPSLWWVSRFWIDFRISIYLRSTKFQAQVAGSLPHIPFSFNH